MSNGVKKQVIQHKSTIIYPCSATPHFKRQKQNFKLDVCSLSSRSSLFRSQFMQELRRQGEGTLASDKEGRKLTFQELVTTKLPLMTSVFKFNQQLSAKIPMVTCHLANFGKCGLVHFLEFFLTKADFLNIFILFVLIPIFPLKHPHLCYNIFLKKKQLKA